MSQQNKTQRPYDLPWDPNCKTFPSRGELPKIVGAPEEAAWVWGENDFVGRLNLLTPSRVKEAAQEIRNGEVIPVNLPLKDPSYPAFLRESFHYQIKTIVPNLVYDDIYHLNTQSVYHIITYYPFTSAAVNKFGTKWQRLNIVVVPFVALMDDLVDLARAFGIDCLRWLQWRRQDARSGSEWRGWWW